MVRGLVIIGLTAAISGCGGTAEEGSIDIPARKADPEVDPGNQKASAISKKGRAAGEQLQDK